MVQKNDPGSLLETFWTQTSSQTSIRDILIAPEGTSGDVRRKGGPVMNYVTVVPFLAMRGPQCFFVLCLSHVLIIDLLVSPEPC